MSEEFSLRLLNQKNYQTYNRNVAHILGDVYAAIILQELIDRQTYHEENPLHEPFVYDGIEYWYETHETMEKRTGIKRKGQDRAIKILIEHGLIKKITKGLPQKRYFHLIKRAILQLYNRPCYLEEQLKIESLNCPNGTKQFVQNGQIETSKMDKLKTAQVPLGEKDPYIDYEPNKEPKKTNTDINKGTNPNPNPNPNFSDEKKEEQSRTKADIERKFVMVDELLKKETDMNFHERRTFLHRDIDDIIKALVYIKQNPPKFKPEKFGAYLHSIINQKKWEDNIPTEPSEESKNLFEVLKIAYKAVRDDKKHFECIDIGEGEIIARKGSECVTTQMRNMTRETFSKEFTKLNDILQENCKCTLECVTLEDGKTKTFRIKEIQ